MPDEVDFNAVLALKNRHAVHRRQLVLIFNELHEQSPKWQFHSVFLATEVPARFRPHDFAKRDKEVQLQVLVQLVPNVGDNKNTSLELHGLPLRELHLFFRHRKTVAVRSEKQKDKPRKQNDQPETEQAFETTDITVETPWSGTLLKNSSSCRRVLDSLQNTNKHEVEKLLERTAKHLRENWSYKSYKRSPFG